MYRIYAIIILSVLLFLALGAGGWLYSRWRAEAKERKSLIMLNSKTVQEVETYKNKNGNLVVQNESLTFDNSTIKQLHKEGQMAILDEFKELKKNYRNLENLVQAKLNVDNSIDLNIKPDSSFNYDDEFRKLSGDIKKIGTHYKLSIKDSVIVPLSMVIYWDKKWLFGKKSYFAAGTSANKKVIITGLESIQIKRRKGK